MLKSLENSVSKQNIHWEGGNYKIEMCLGLGGLFGGFIFSLYMSVKLLASEQQMC